MTLVNHPLVVIILSLLGLYYFFVVFFYKKSSKEEIQEVLKEDREKNKPRSVLSKKQILQIVITLIISIPNIFVVLGAIGFGASPLMSVIFSLVTGLAIWCQFSLIKKSSPRWYFPVVILLLIWLLPSLPGLLDVLFMYSAL